MSYLEILRKLVEFRTYDSDGTHRCTEYLSNELSRAGFRVAVDDLDNVYGTKEFDHGTGTFLLETNFDTVDSTANWTKNPLSLTQEGDRLYGLDTSTKGGIAAVLQVLGNLPRSRFKKIEVLFSTNYKRLGEEIGIEYFLSGNKLEARLGINLNATVHGDRFMVSLGCGGSIKFTVTTIGKQAHIMDPSWQTMSRNAIYDMMKVIEALRKMPTARMTIDDFDIHAGLNVSMIEGGTASIIVPSECKITCSRLVLPNEDWDGVKKGVENALRTVRDANFKVNYFRPEKPYLIDRTNPAVALAVDSVQSTLGYTPRFNIQAGITDCAELDQMGDVKTVTMGPGDPFLASSSDEYVSAKRIDEFTRIIRYVLTESEAPSVS